MIDSNYERTRKNNIEAYGLLFDLENILRELIAARLRTEHKGSWQKRGLPPDIRDKVSSTIRHERSIPWSRLTPHHPLYYTDFPDLRKIVTNGTNWPLFTEFFHAKSGTDISLSDVESVRNKVAHNRLVSDGDLSVLKGTYTKVLDSLDSLSLEAAKNAICSILSISECLSDIQNSFSHALEVMPSGHILSADRITSLKLLDEWWFDDDYLGEGTSQLRHFSGICKQYSDLPSGIGQAVARREWVKRNQAADLASQSTALIESMIKKASKTYA